MDLTDAPVPQLAFFAELAVLVGAPVEVGRTPRGLRRMIPITGGQARGDGWTARVLPGGADWQLVVGDTLAELQAHYVLETDGGDRIYVHNRAIRHAAAEVTARLVRGEAVDPALVYFRCLPSLETGAPSLQWVNERLFVGSGVRRPHQVEMRFFQLA
ncbi:MAG TPA: DUF3237 domain-containing protein [Ramlibacter sp.]|jgi:hypothetical protein|uniref:DUF3237 domain-containing protein n=1 Tax=Ramlibacter sp. TaxID=1917967 RepID=UPI002D42642B|nr:DUF3237 domain-containing protein [Ramlibacter sp.]HZY18758.1 DUF3237 domain-containing protein [Ramlibacter sp.]